jgi:Fic family protein
MDVSAFTNPSGRLIQTIQGYDAFVPAPLPAELDLDRQLVFLLSEADRSLGELSGMAQTLPNPRLLVAPLSQREAVLSSRIEGTQASISDIAIFEAAGESMSRSTTDVLEVLNYRRAMEHGLTRMSSLPLGLRLVQELHEHLLTGVRGQETTPGEFRKDQNWIGTPGSLLPDATYVPPPPYELMDCLSAWEKFLYAETLMPPLVKCALMHYQFEAIHPFRDGNGRVGRLLLVLFLCSMGHLPAPVLYLSPYFEKNRDAYYFHLREVSEKSAFFAWLAFFLRGVIVQCKDSFIRSERIMKLHEQYRDELLKHRAPPSAQRLMEHLFVSPATTASRASAALKVTSMSSSRAIEVLVERGILEEVTGRRRDRIYLARRLIHAIEDESGVNHAFDHQTTLL